MRALLLPFLLILGTNKHHHGSFVGAFASHSLCASPPTTTITTTTCIFAQGSGDKPTSAHEEESSVSKNATGGGRRGFLGKTGAATAATLSIGLPNNDASRVANAAVDVSPSSPSSASPRVVLWGFGSQNKLMARYLHEKKIPVVGVVSHHDVGQDYGLLDDYGPLTKSIKRKTGVKIVDEASSSAMLRSTQPNVCLLATKSTLADIYPTLKTCATHGVNVITIAEELLFGRGSSPRLTKDLDALFQTNGVSVTGSGFIDGACCEMALALSSCMHRIEGMEGTLRYDADVNGPVLASAHGIGLTPEEFELQIVRNLEQEKSYVYNSNEWFASAFGLHVVRTKEVRTPIINDSLLSTSTSPAVPVYSKAMDKTIPVGGVLGMKVVATTTTKEGVTICAEQNGSVYTSKDDKDYTGWKFLGEPRGVGFTIDNPPTSEMTNTATISRISQIIEAKAGYVTTDSLEIARYRHWS